MAFSLFLKHGGQHGRDREDWLQAEQSLLHPHSGAPVNASAPADHWTPMVSTSMVNHPHERDARHSPSRREIRQMNTSHRPAARESQRAAE
jgi:hypothetical protein